MFKALSNPHRLEIFAKLASCCTPGTVHKVDEQMEAMFVGELAEGLGIAPSTVSHHLKELSHAGLVKMARQGKFVECSIDPGILDELSAFFAERIKNVVGG